MEKIIRQSGNSKFIRLDKEDCEINNLETGDIVDIKIVKVNGEKDESLK